ncbi:hypothetical protein WDV76_02920 [Xenorhabdus griffiniae]|uniref:hypothetical protein n=1 Tax=Xenorhabdus griffiniae TaxID=351672 RepID=UPI0030D02EB4
MIHSYIRQLTLLKTQIESSLRYIESIQSKEAEAESAAENDLKLLLPYHLQKLDIAPSFDKQRMEEKAILSRACGSKKHPVTWIIQLGAENVLFSRVINGRIDESYVSVNRQKANVYAAAILNDLEPPRHLQKSDKPTGQTQSE